jgi:uncharacterized protein (TIGR03382 family)
VALRRVGPLLLVGLGMVGAASRARADGAFPDELQVFLPASPASRILLTTNFGLLRSDDDGQSFQYLCEPTVGTAENVSLYQLSTSGTLLADSPSGLFRSTDVGCSWGKSGGALASVYTLDAAFDPNHPGRALAIGAATSINSLYPSDDDAATFAAPTFSLPGRLSGVEFSESSDGVVYATGIPATGPDASVPAPFILASSDRGQNWTRFDHPELAGSSLRVAQVDPLDGQTIYLRLLPGAASSDGGPSGDSLAVSHDGGKTVSILYTLTEAMTAFLRAADGTLYLGTRGQGLYAASPGTSDFVVRNPLRVRCLGERAGTLYACGDNWLDGFALGSSTDGGRTFHGLISFVQIAGLAVCPGTPAAPACARTWSALSQLFGIDAGAADGGSGVPPAKSGCGCQSAGEGLPLIPAFAWLLRRRRGSA